MAQDSFWEEHFEKTKENFALQMEIQHSLREATAGIPNLRVLDYGAGAVPYAMSTFSRVQPDQQVTIAYDPYLDKPRKATLFSKTEWTTKAPSGQLFDLAVCHFSLHHMSKQPQEAIRDLEIYQPKVILIANYDFTGASLSEFDGVFISQTELKELKEMFGNDSESCYRFHHRHGTSDFLQALTENGFVISKTVRGQGIARYKFFMLGKTA